MKPDVLWTETPVVEKIQAIEYLLGEARINYRLPYVFEKDMRNNREAKKLVVFKYGTRIGNSAKANSYWPILACCFGQHSCALHTGLWHDTWAFPLITNDTTIVHNPAQYKRPAPRREALSAMMSQIEYIYETHTSRIVRMREQITTMQAHDLYLSILRGGAVGKRRGMWFKMFLLLPPIGERLSLLDHISILTNHLIDGDVYTLGLLLGKLSDHMLLGLEPLLQNRIVFRIRDADTPERREKHAKVQWKRFHATNRGQFFAGEERRRKGKESRCRDNEENREDLHETDDSEMDGGSHSIFQHDFDDL